MDRNQAHSTCVCHMDGTAPVSCESIPGELRTGNSAGILHVNGIGPQPPVRCNAMVHQQRQFGHDLYVGSSRYMVRKPYGDL